jgi:hypothetical protein
MDIFWWQSQAMPKADVGPVLLQNDIRRRANTERYEPDIDARFKARLSLGSLDPEERRTLPPRVHVTRPPTDRMLFIYAMNRGPFILPPEAHRTLVSLGAEGHEFHEIEAIADGVSLGPYFLQIQAPVIDCVDIDNSIFRDGRGREYFDEVMSRSSGPGGVGSPRVSLGSLHVIALKHAVIQSHHWWRAPRAFSGDHFCSGALRKAFKEAGVYGLQFTPCQTT